jgi:hypothetical protein
VTTFEPSPHSEPRRVTSADARASWLLALLRDVAIIVAVIVYLIDTL